MFSSILNDDIRNKIRSFFDEPLGVKRNVRHPALSQYGKYVCRTTRLKDDLTVLSRRHYNREEDKFYDMNNCKFDEVN